MTINLNRSNDGRWTAWCVQTYQHAVGETAEDVLAAIGYEIDQGSRPSNNYPNEYK